MLLIGTALYLLATHPDKPFKSLADLIAAAKAKPGALSYGSVGTGPTNTEANNAIAR